MKNAEILNAGNHLKSIDFNSIKNGRFQYALLKNQNRLQAEAGEINKSVQKLQTEKLTAFIESNHKKVAAELNQLINEKNIAPAEVIAIEKTLFSQCEKWEEVRKDYEDYINAKIDFLTADNNEFKPYKMPVELIEQLELNQAQMAALWLLIEDEDGSN